MLRLTIISLVLVCAVHANLFGSIMGVPEENVPVAADNGEQSQGSQNEETGLAIIGNDDQPIAAMDDLAAEGQSGVVIRAKRYYGCGCGCCGCGCCGTVAPTATVMSCGCGCCGCGWG